MPTRCDFRAVVPGRRLRKAALRLAALLLLMLPLRAGRALRLGAQGTSRRKQRTGGPARAVE